MRVRHRTALILLACAATATHVQHKPGERVVLKNGTRMDASVANCRGSAGRPMTDDDITEKTRDQLRTAFPADRAEQILDQSWRIEKLPLVDPFCKQLAAA